MSKEKDGAKYETEITSATKTTQGGTAEAETTGGPNPIMNIYDIYETKTTHPPLVLGGPIHAQ